MKELLYIMGGFSAGILVAALFYNSANREEGRTIITYFKPKHRREHQFISRIVSNADKRTATSN